MGCSDGWALLRKFPVGAVRPLETVDQRALVVGDGFRLPCSDVLSIGPIRPLLTAASLLTWWGKDGWRLSVTD